MAYVVDGGEVDYADLFHQRFVTIPDRVADEFLYARFAYCIINQDRDDEFSTIALPINAAVRVARAKRVREKASKRKGPAPDTIDESEEQDTRTYTVLFYIC